MPSSTYNPALAQAYIQNQLSYLPQGAARNSLEKMYQDQFSRGTFQHMANQQGSPGVLDLSALSQQVQQATDPSFLNNLFNVSAGNLSQIGQQQAARARTRAAAQAGSRGFLNPTAFINSQGAQAQAPFTAQMGGLEAERARALAQNALTGVNLQYMLNRAAQGDEQAAQQIALQLAQQQIQRQQLAQQQAQFDAQNNIDFWDVAGLGLGIAAIPGSGTFLKGLFG